MSFVRLAGCNAPELGLGCVEWCDTSESWDLLGGRDMAVGEILDRVRLPRLCLTGGEPLLQMDGVTELVAAAHERSIAVHLETNGTLDGPCDIDWVTVSPKPPAYMIMRSWYGRIDELKLIVDPDFDPEVAERLASDHPGAIVCLQPEYGGGPDESRGRAAIERAMALVMAHPEWRLSLQLHKQLGIR